MKAQIPESSGSLGLGRLRPEYAGMLVCLGYFVLNAAFRAYSFSDNCPLGDQPGVVYNGTNCTALIKDFNGYCYQDSVQLTCCSACAAVYRPVQSKFGFYFFLRTFS